MNDVNDIFKEYGSQGPSTIQEAIERFSVDLLMLMCGCPKKIVLDKHTYNRYQMEILKNHRDNDEVRAQVMSSKKFSLPLSSGLIEIICED